MLRASYPGTVTTATDAVPVAVTVEVGQGGLAARSADGRAFEVAYVDLSLETGGFDGGFIFCRPRSGAFTLALSGGEVLSVLRGVPALHEELAKVRSENVRRGRWKLMSATALILVAVAVGVLVWQLPSILASQVKHLPTSVDKAIGDAAIESVAAGPTVTDPRVQGFLDAVVARLQTEAPHGFEFRVRVVRNAEVNAFALPGGHLVVLTGLLERATRAEQVYGVMAHELAHVTRRHSLRNMAHQVSTGLALQLLLGDLEGWTALGANLAVTAQQNEYSREQESDADAEGARMLAAAGLDPEGLVSFFMLLKDEPASELAGVMNWFSTHPEHDARIAHVRSVARQFPASARRPLDVDFAAVKAALRELGEGKEGVGAIPN